MRSALAFIILTVSLTMAAQQSLPTPEQAKEYIDRQTRSDVLDYEEGSAEYKLLDGHKKGDIVLNGKHIYNIYSFKIDPVYSCGYIFLDGNKLSADQIKALQKTIIERHEKGEPFKDLVKEYSMDGNPDAANFRFSQGEVNDVFARAIQTHEYGEAFAINIPEEKWYYIAIVHAGSYSKKIISAAHYYYPN